MVEIIVTHDVADFDAFASAVAAQKLHPDAHIVLGRRIGRSVRDFLALHKDRFRFLRQPDIDQDAVTHLIVVDVRSRDRLKGWEPLIARIDARATTARIDARATTARIDARATTARIDARAPTATQPRVTVWDHHGATDDDLPADTEVVDRVGSATTLLLEEMRSRRIPIDPTEATLFALGIHTDTGSLVFSTSTARDARALSWLMDQGASLSVLNRYLSEPMTSAQRAVLAELLGAVETTSVAGLDVGFATITLDKVVDGVDVVTSEALSLLDHHALFALFVVKHKVQVVGRARSAFFDVGLALRTLGGGGHAPAGAASIKDRTPEDVRAAILEALRRDPPRPRRVADIMSSPVRTISPELPLHRLADSLRTWRHTGVPVLRDGQLVGIVSRRDVEKATRDGRLHLPVASCMTSEVCTTTEETPLEEALAHMVSEDVGRLPVLRGERLVGIVSRSDVLRALYTDDAATSANSGEQESRGGPDEHER